MTPCSLVYNNQKRVIRSPVVRPNKSHPHLREGESSRALFRQEATQGADPTISIRGKREEPLAPAAVTRVQQDWQSPFAPPFLWRDTLATYSRVQRKSAFNTTLMEHMNSPDGRAPLPPPQHLHELSAHPT
jgi:hypothetical protein